MYEMSRRQTGIVHNKHQESEKAGHFRKILRQSIRFFLQQRNRSIKKRRALTYEGFG